MADDGYGPWYGEKLWRLLPTVYRSLDSSRPGDPPGPLRELIGRIGGQAAVVRRSIDRLWDDQSIETCDDWVIPYIGELLATRMVSCLDGRGQRLDVERTIYRRRRGGTLGLLEELAVDIADSEVRVVEFFRRLARTRHQFDPPIGQIARFRPGDAPSAATVEGLVGAFSRTPAGGLADLRNVYGASNAGTAFDEFAHTADFRRGRQSAGWHNISRLGVFIWWLKSFPILGATPVERVGCPGQFTFDPSGREAPLFAPSERTGDSYGEHWVSTDEWQLPTPIRKVLWRVAQDRLYRSAMSVGLGADPNPALIDPAGLEIDPEAGRFRFLGPRPAGRLGVAYHFGFSAKIGAGGHDRRVLPDLDLPATTATVVAGASPDPAIAAMAGATADATLLLGDSSTLPGPASDLVTPADLTVAIAAADGCRPLLRWTAPASAWRIAGGGGKARLVVEGVWLQGADIVLAGDFETVVLRLCTLDPGTSGAGQSPPALFGSAIDGLALRPAVLFIEGRIGSLRIERCICGPIRTRNGGTVESLSISDSILQSLPTHDPSAPPTFYDPWELAARAKLGGDPAATALRAALPSAAALQLAAYVPMQGQAPPAGLASALQAALAGLTAKAQAAFPLATADLALGLAGGEASLERVTVLGPIQAHRLSASECVLDETARVDDAQHGCVRFCAIAQGSNLHSPYRSTWVRPRSPLFHTRLFGRPDYARLRRDADAAIVAPAAAPGAPPPSILAGAEDGGEPGAFCGERRSLKRRGLAQKYEEFMPIGLTPVWIDAD